MHVRRVHVYVQTSSRRDFHYGRDPTAYRGTSFTWRRAYKCVGVHRDKGPTSFLLLLSPRCLDFFPKLEGSLPPERGAGPALQTTRALPPSLCPSMTGRMQRHARAYVDIDAKSMVYQYRTTLRLFDIGLLGIESIGIRNIYGCIICNKGNLLFR